MLLAILLGLNLVNVVLSVVAVYQRKTAMEANNSFSRERKAWAVERQELIDRVLLQKGYREFAPPQTVNPVLKSLNEEDWVEKSEEEGFQPL